jgi:hypothetical protein
MTVPADCSSAGPSENSLATFGANGLLGLNQAIPDCGATCADPAAVATGYYYSCGTPPCTATAIAVADQVSVPVAFFAHDNNGTILDLPAVDPSGAPSLAGTLVFGIGTAPNNGLGGASVLTVDASGNFTTIYKGATFATSFIDSGSNSLSFNDATIAQCAATAGFFCPATTLMLSAQNRGANGVTATVSFRVGNTDALFASATDSVFDDLAGPGSDATSFDWGLPFCFGRRVYVALDGAATPAGPGPFFAW